MVTSEMKPGLYRHWSGSLYRVVSTAIDATNASGGRRVVVYRSEADHERWFVRDLEEFTSVVHTQDGSTCPGPHCFRAVDSAFADRFKYVGEAPPESEGSQ